MRAISMGSWYLIFFLISCVPINNVLKENNPSIRELKVVAFLGGYRTKGQAEFLVKQTNDILETQIGVRLKIIEWNTEKFPMVGPYKLMAELENRLGGREDFDIGILFTTYNFTEIIISNIIGLYGGITDSFWNRYIIVYTMSQRILTHEIHHCFLGDEVEAFEIKLIPLLPSIGSSGFLTNDKIEKAKRNKWRYFSQSPIEEKAKKLVQYDWKCIHFPHWEESKGKDCGAERKRWENRL